MIYVYDYLIIICALSKDQQLWSKIVMCAKSFPFSMFRLWWKTVTIIIIVNNNEYDDGDHDYCDDNVDDDAAGDDKKDDNAVYHIAVPCLLLSGCWSPQKPNTSIQR